MKYNFKKAYEYAKNASIQELFKRSIVYNAYVGLGMRCTEQTVGHDVVLSIAGSIFGPLGKLDEDGRDKLDEFFKFIDRGFGDWGIKLDIWLKKNATNVNDLLYFEEMYKILMEKSDDVYYLLSNNTNIPADQLLYDIYVAGAALSSYRPQYSDWMYV